MHNYISIEPHLYCNEFLGKQRRGIKSMTMRVIKKRTAVIDF